jgi:hypothetical protein
LSLGARYYYFRNVLHDWDDEKAAEILKQVVPAMGPDSQILVDEVALTDVGAHWFSAAMDMHMHSILEAKERTQAEWHALADNAGLKVVSLKTYSPGFQNSVITMVSK